MLPTPAVSYCTALYGTVLHVTPLIPGALFRSLGVTVVALAGSEIQIGGLRSLSPTRHTSPFLPSHS